MKATFAIAEFSLLVRQLNLSIVVHSGSVGPAQSQEMGGLDSNGENRPKMQAQPASQRQKGVRSMRQAARDAVQCIAARGTRARDPDNRGTPG
jgi:hypothetical protein